MNIIGPDSTESRAVFELMMDNCRKALTTLNILENMHEHKRSLRIATRILDETTRMKPHVTGSELEFLIKTIMQTYSKYSDEYRTFAQDGNRHLLFNLDTNPLNLDKVSIGLITCWTMKYFKEKVESPS